MARRRVATLLCLGLAAALGLAQARWAFADETSPAGTATSVIIVFPPSQPITPVAPAPGIQIGPPPKGLRLPAAATSTPAGAAPNVLLLTPAPGTGSLVMPVRVAPASGSGPSFTQLQLIIPGPNPAQNTTVGLAQLLNALLASAQAAGSGTGTTAARPAPPLVMVVPVSPGP